MYNSIKDERFVNTNEPSFVRDTSTQAILNTNVDAFKAYKHSRNSTISSSKLQEQVVKLQDDVDKLHQSMDKIISLLTKNQ